MVEKVIYVADDGTEFNSEEKCWEYETSDIFCIAKKYIHLMDENGVGRFFGNWNEFEHKLLEAATEYINIDTDIDEKMLQAIITFMKDNYCYVNMPPRAGEYRWDYEEDEWISYEDDYAKFQHNWRHRRG